MKIIKIGKEVDNDITIEGDPSVSRYHIQLFIDDEGNVFVTDCDSTNGTYINGQRINESIKLETYDVLKIANTIINWKQLLQENVDLKEAYETFQDKLSIREDYPIKQKKTTEKYYLIIIICLIISLLIIFSLFN